MFRNDTEPIASPDVLTQEAEQLKPILLQDQATRSDLTEIVEQFDQLTLHESLLRGIYGYGFERPSEVQQKALKPCIAGSLTVAAERVRSIRETFTLLAGCDVIVQAQSGTGKSAAYIIAVLQRIDLDCKDFQALILAPTRELAQGVWFFSLSLSHLYVHSVGKLASKDGVSSW